MLAFAAAISHSAASPTTSSPWRAGLKSEDVLEERQNDKWAKIKTQRLNVRVVSQLGGILGSNTP